MPGCSRAPRRPRPRERLRAPSGPALPAGAERGGARLPGPPRAGAGGAAAAAAWPSPVGLRDRRCGEVSALRDGWGSALPRSPPFHDPGSDRGTGLARQSLGWGATNTCGAAGAPRPGAVGLVCCQSERGSEESRGQPVPFSRWLRGRESLWVLLMPVLPRLAHGTVGPGRVSTSESRCRGN